MLCDQLQLRAVENNVNSVYFCSKYFASTMKYPAHSSRLTLHNGLFVWLLYTDLHTTYIQHANLHTILPADCIFDK